MKIKFDGSTAWIHQGEAGWNAFQFREGTIWDGNWWLVNYDEDTEVATWLTTEDGKRYIQRRDEPRQDIIASAAADRLENAGKRWGDGQVIGTVPEGYAWSSGYMRAKAEGDTAWIKRFWNDRDNRNLRTFEGKV